MLSLWLRRVAMAAAAMAALTRVRKYVYPGGRKTAEDSTSASKKKKGLSDRELMISFTDLYSDVSTKLVRSVALVDTIRMQQVKGTLRTESTDVHMQTLTTMKSLRVIGRLNRECKHAHAHLYHPLFRSKVFRPYTNSLTTITPITFKT